MWTIPQQQQENKDTYIKAGNHMMSMLPNYWPGEATKWMS